MIIVAHPRHQKQRLHVALLEDVFDLCLTQHWIDGHQHQPSFGSAHHKQGPLGQIGRQDSDMIPFVQSQGNQPLCDLIGPLTILLVGPAQIERFSELRITGIDHRFLSGKLICATI